MGLKTKLHDAMRSLVSHSLLIGFIVAAVGSVSHRAAAQGDGGPSDPPYQEPTEFYTGYGYIYASNSFPADKRDFLLNTLNLMSRTNFGFLTSPNGPLINPYGHLTYYIGRVNYVAPRAGNYAYTFRGGDINIHDYSPWHSQAVMAAIFLHEADHHRYGSHTCGSGDTSIDSPTGAGILYGAKLYHSGALSASERSFIYSDSGARISAFLCNNVTSMNIGSQALYNNVWPVRPPPQPPREVCGGRTRIMCR